jgi:hypothetical protein
MTIKELQDIIDLNQDSADMGHLQAQGQVIEAQAEIERLERRGCTLTSQFPPLSVADQLAFERDMAQLDSLGF